MFCGRGILENEKGFIKILPWVGFKVFFGSFKFNNIRERVLQLRLFGIISNFLSFL